MGTGEYTTGFVGGGQSGSDKKVGVVGLTLFDLRRRGKVGELSMAGTSGTKFPAIRSHLQKNITQTYNGLSTDFTSYPSDSTSRDPEAYKAAIDGLKPGSAVTIFTPDPTHYPIACYAIDRGHHVLLTKPATQTLEHHIDLMRRAREKKVLVMVEHHKRFDPAYADARHRALQADGPIGDFSYFYSYMSQPKSQLETFKAWAGKDSDISYYLNSHHIDVHASMVLANGWVPSTVMASGGTGIAESMGCQKGTEDVISLLVTWTHKQSGRVGTAVYTASWTAPLKAGLHSQQQFHYVGSKGEININQAKRGYEVTQDPSEGNAGGLSWLNPFYMRYSPDESGNFAGQGGYGYVSFEKFVDAVAELKDGADVEAFDKRGGGGLPTLANTVVTAAILEAGRRSLDEKRIVSIDKDDSRGEEGWSLR